MKVLNKLAIRNIKLNKKRSIAIIIGIVLSSFLITAVTTLVSSFLQTIIEYEKRITGDYHYQLIDVPKEDLDILQKNDNIENLFVTQEIGYTELSNNNNYKPYGYIMAFSNEAFEKLNIKVIEGRLPENENEIVIQRQMLALGNMDWEIGDEITLNIGKRIKNGEELNQNNVLINSIEDQYEEKIVTEKVSNYKIVGIIETPNMDIEPLKAPGFTMLTCLNNIKDGNLNVYIRYNNLMEKEEIKNYKFNANSNLILLEGMSFEEETMKIIYIIAAIIIFIIIFTSVYCIRNSFEISITEKIKQYGMLSAIGATSKQLRYSVFIEGIILGLIGIPIGIFLGAISIFILFNILQNIFGEQLLGTSFVFSVDAVSIIIAVILNMVTIYLLSRKSAKKASKILPIEAIRGNQDVKTDMKPIKESKLVKKLFGIGGVLSYKNLKRNKKKYKTTTISIIISVTAFIAMVSFVHYALEKTNNYYNYDYNIHLTGSEQNYDILKEISKNSNIKEWSINRVDNIKIIDSQDEEDYRYYNLYSVGEQEYKNFVKELGLDYDEAKDKLIWLKEVKEDEQSELIRSLGMKDYKKGEVIQGKIQEKEVIVEVIIDTKKRPLGLSEIERNCAVVSEEFWEEHNMKVDDSNIEMYINTSDANEFEEYFIKNYSFSGIEISNMETPVRNQRALWLLIASFLYGLIGVISLIGITNIFNTITTSMELRSKEFATLRSIGMTNREFNRMIGLESIFYGLKSLIIGIPLGIVFSYLIYMAFNSDKNLNYVLPINAIITVSVIICILIGIIMRYSLNKINKKNIIETIKNENI